MNKKQLVHFALTSIIILLIVLPSISPVVLAKEKKIEINGTQETIQVNKAFTWLVDNVRGKWDKLPVEETALSLLTLAWDDALGGQGLLALNEKSKNSEKECWPSSCKVKETAFAVLTLSQLGRDTGKAEDWLLEQDSTPSELEWYMQLDSLEEAVCTIGYNEDSNEYNITIGKDKKINKAAGSCLSLSYGDYWFKVSKSCYEKTFTITCEQDFVATMFYKKPGTTSIYISSDTKRESAGGYSDLRINSICLKQYGKCDYESTAWAAVGMVKTRDVSIFMPYLVGYADKNREIMPEAFLYMITGQEGYAKTLVNKQNRNGYWDESSKYTRYYDTALALLALGNYDIDSKNKAKAWLLERQVTSGAGEGSWGSSKKDTAFLLYAIWPKDFIPSFATITDDDEENISMTLQCTDYGYYCLPSYDCDFDSRVKDYYCNGMQICCKQKTDEKPRTCNEMGGQRCEIDWGPDYSCVGTTTSATDGICCIGSCRTTDVDPDKGYECVDEGYTCRYYCYEEDEEELYLGCPGTKICCAPKDIPITPERKSRLWILWVFLLILAGVLIFLFRDKIKQLPIFKKFRGGGSVKFKPPRPGGFPPRGPPGAGTQAARPRIFGLLRKPGVPITPVRPAGPGPAAGARKFALKKTARDKELEETLKKLREAGK